MNPSLLAEVVSHTTSIDRILEQNKLKLIRFLKPGLIVSLHTDKLCA